MTQQYQLQVNQVSKQFHGNGVTTRALDQVSFNVVAGEFVCILGPSGCGKTTILRSLAGLDMPSAGTIEWHGLNGSALNLGMVFQEQSVFPWMTVAANIRFFIERDSRFSASEVDDTVSDLLQEVGLADFANFFPHQLSGGMRQRVAIARAFAHKPQVLLMDEPFVYLDYQTRLNIQQLLLQLWQRHAMTVMFVTHDIEEAVLLADRVIVMSAAPAVVKAEVPVPFERPRDLYALKQDMRLHHTVAELTDLLREEFVDGE